MDETLKDQLIALRQRDQTTRERLAATGILFDGCSEEMESIHAENAAALETIMEEVGWPGISVAGEEGSEAAWMVAQHAISRPHFQCRCLEVLSMAVADGDAMPWQEAYLSDRIHMYEQQPQI